MYPPKGGAARSRPWKGQVLPLPASPRGAALLAELPGQVSRFRALSAPLLALPSVAIGGAAPTELQTPPSKKESESRPSDAPMKGAPGRENPVALDQA